VGDGRLSWHAVSAGPQRVAGALAALVLLSLRGYAAEHAAVPDEDAGRGPNLYATYCAACHQANGEGMAGAFPPLKGSAVVNRADATRHIDIVLAGLQGARVAGVTYTNPMPGFGTTLSDEDIAAIIDYERSAWGNHGSGVGPAQVASERARLK
jgi:cytochrome c oxidase cbb3-type subunit 2